MKNILKLLFFSGIIALAAFSCDDEKDNPSDYKPIEIKKITDFGCEVCYLRINQEHDKDDTCYVINTKENFEEIVEYISEESIPSIDFEKYFLIIGTIFFPTWAEIVEENAKENDLEIVYQVHYKIYGYTLPGVLNYHAFIEKPVSDKTIQVELIKE